MQSKKEREDLIKWRGIEVTRIEAFSDAVFAFAVTLMIVSLEVPHNFHELAEMMKGFIPFAISFTIFFFIWTEQNAYFRRFNLHDGTTMWLNAALLFFVLFFVYPLKFLFTAFWHFDTAFTNQHEVNQLMQIYGFGYGTIHIILALLYRHAHKKEEVLQLTVHEKFEVRTYMYRNIAIAGVAALSIIISLFRFPMASFFSGIIYSLIGVVISVTHGKRSKVHKKKFGILPHEVVTEEVATHHHDKVEEN